ncbi:PAS domain-containing protein [Clostridium chromiireducens]|uniref:histidine kinase n=1 Tax=Clostridium chromiireducens TaxID=225345 RepID=A0A399INQ9_9CLOT|nr:ATP-binding protein [Clostridium chromiireducens]RII32596.1 PAS domain-containing protein [Clostridium chromiireducens]
MKQKLKYKLLIIILITIISILHYMSDTVNSPLHQFYRLLYFIPIIIAAFNFGFKGSIVITLLVSLIYSPQRLLFIGFKFEAITELLDILLFFAVGAISGILIEKRNLAFLEVDSQLKKYMILENYTNSIIQSIKSGVVAINNDFFITSINNSAKEILNMPGDVIGQNFFDLNIWDEVIKKQMINAVENERFVKDIEIELSNNDKNIVIKVDVYPLSLENRNKGLVLIIDDITEIKKIKHQMQRNDKLASVGQLATGIAHEIRNPLAIIKMIEQTMVSELKDNKEVVKELEIIDEEIERANKVIKSLMEFGKPSKNERNLYSLNQVIEDVLIIVNKYTDQHNVEVNLLTSDIPIIELDKEQLKQAFVNLMFNAVDAMPNGGIVNISTEIYEDKWIRIIFEDTGQGISEESIEKIFDPFYTTKDEGTGLGLPIVHRIIEDHGGIINVYSKIGEGTRFEILFPRNLEGGI